MARSLEHRSGCVRVLGHRGLWLRNLPARYLGIFRTAVAAIWIHPGLRLDGVEPLKWSFGESSTPGIRHKPLTDRARQEVTCVSAARSEVHVPSARWSLLARV